MHSRAARLILLLLFVGALLTTAYLFWKSEALASSHADAASAFDAAVRTAQRALLDVRSDQRGYIAAGQGGDFWAARVAHHVDGLRRSLPALRSSSVSPEAQSSIDQVVGLLDDFAKADKRAVEYTRRDQRLLASDVIFEDGFDLTEGALASLDQARAAELSSRTAAMVEARRRGVFAIVAGMGAAALAVLLLLPVPAAGRMDEAAVARAAAGAARSAEVQKLPIPAEESEEWSRPRRLEQEPATVEAMMPPLTVRAQVGTPSNGASGEQENEARARAEAAPVSAAEAAAAPRAVADEIAQTDFPGLAALCADLARIADTRALPSLLDRAASLLDASGIILWIADPDGRELNPIFAQGYPQQLVNRLGTIPRDAENATAAAFRTALLQTVMADRISPGAIAAPLVTPGGCVGVMAAEVRHDAERQGLTLAAATIVAAQLATLVGPPAAKNHTKAGAAGA
jgi:CHASE3 domain sensor protein